MSSRSLNKVMLIGNLTRDPELRYTPQGTAVCTFGLATNRSWLPEGAAERKEEAEFHRIVAWNKLAELCSQLLTKGRKVYVEGRLSTRTWTAQDGTSRTTTEVVIDDMIILDSRKNFEEQAVSNTAPRQTYAAPSTTTLPPPAPVAVPPVEETAAPKKKITAKQEEEAPKKEEKPEENYEEPTKDELNTDDIPF